MRVGPWVRGAVVGTMFVLATRCRPDERGLASAEWLEHRRNLEIVERTFPPRWSKARKWSIEVESDPRDFHGHMPERALADYSIVDIDDTRALVGVEIPKGYTHVRLATRFIWDMRRFSLQAIPGDEAMAPLTFESVGYGWQQVDEDRVPFCGGTLSPWGGPIVYRTTVGGDVRDVLGERWFGGIRQLGWVEGGFVRFEIHPAKRDDAILSIAWRPGDPWWTKLECYYTGRDSNPPTPPREWWLVPRHARARLVAIDGVPIEPLPWEHPPADWMDPSGR